MPVGRRRMVCRSHSAISRRRIVSPAPASNSTLSGSTTAARPLIFSIVLMCCRKFSCLLDVEAQKSSRTMTRSSRCDLPGLVDHRHRRLPPERRIRRHHVEPHPRISPQRVDHGDQARPGRGADAVQQQVHRTQPGGAVDDLPPVHGLVAQEPLVVDVHRLDVVIHHPLMRRQQEPARADRRVRDRLARAWGTGRPSSPGSAGGG